MSASSELVLAIVGPTASGKSALAVDVAEAVRGEIVSIDSTAIYRGMDIGTDKPPKDLTDRISHHLLDVVPASETVSVARFQQLAREAVADISRRGLVPILVGGSGLYFRAVVDPLTFPGTDEEVRARISAWGEEDGADALHAYLTQVDPEAASRIDRQNIRRSIRALEVIEITGKPFSSFRQGWDEYQSIYDLHVAGLTHPIDELDARINARSDSQIEAGLLDELEALIAAGLRDSVTSVQALGYAQLLEHLDGRMTQQEAIDEIKRRTRKFARRQLSWFKADPRVVWFQSDPVGARDFLIEKGSGR